MQYAGLRYFPGVRQGVSGLEAPERLIVNAVRLWLQAPTNWPLVAEDFRLAFGDNESLFALNGLKGLLQVLAAHARRTLYFHRPCCSRISADERALLTLVSALQHGRQDHTHAVLRWLVPEPQQTEAYKHAFWLAGGMAECGLLLQPPGEGAPSWC
jgi:hypothetical protein